MKKKLRKTLESLKNDIFKPLSREQSAKIVGGTDQYTKVGGVEVLDTGDC